jgi:hypothetical protein
VTRYASVLTRHRAAETAPALAAPIAAAAPEVVQ